MPIHKDDAPEPVQRAHAPGAAEQPHLERDAAEQVRRLLNLADTALAAPGLDDSLCAVLTGIHEQLAALEVSQEALAERDEALLRVARRFAAKGDADHILSDLLADTVALLNSDDGLVSRWDAAQGGLVLVHRLRDQPGGVTFIRPGEGVTGRAAQQRRTIILNDYQQAYREDSRLIDRGPEAAIAAPLLHEGRLLGALLVQSLQPGKRYSADDARIIELLASLAAATIVGLEQARLEGVLLAARTAQHELSNQLALTVGHSELLAANPDLPPHLRELAEEALHGARAAAETLRRFQRISHLTETDWGPNTRTTIDLTRSSD